MKDTVEQIFDIYDVWYEPLLTQAWFVMTLIVILSIIITIILYMFYVKYSHRVVKIHPLVSIEQQLHGLKKTHVENEQDCKRVYFQATKIIKEYLAYRYQISVVGLTDREIVEWAYLVVPEDTRVMLKHLLLDVTSIKFEHQVVTTQQLKEYIQLMEDFIKKTTPDKKTTSKQKHRKES